MGKLNKFTTDELKEEIERRERKVTFEQRVILEIGELLKNVHKVDSVEKDMDKRSITFGLDGDE